MKKVLMKNLFFFLFFPTYVPVTLIKSKLQIHPANPTNPDILKFITKFLKIKKVLLKIQDLPFIH